MNLSQKEKRWSKDVVKYIAMAAMLLNHIAYIFLPEGILFEIFLNLLPRISHSGDDVLLPSGGLSIHALKRRSICRDWFCSPFFRRFHTVWRLPAVRI